MPGVWRSIVNRKRVCLRCYAEFRSYETWINDDVEGIIRLRRQKKLDLLVQARDLLNEAIEEMNQLLGKNPGTADANRADSSEDDGESPVDEQD